MPANQKPIRALRKALREQADPERAAQQQAYMKSEMPFYGVAAAPLRKTAKDVFKAHPFDNPDDWVATVLELWRTARHREDRHAAITWFGMHKKWLTLDVVPALEEMITTGAWWDYVDALAANHTLQIMKSDLKGTTKLMRQWARRKDLWLRRTSILCQLKRKQETDETLLVFAINHSIDDRDFFARKAIGWALREYAKTNPDWVRAFVEERREDLSPLSIREATKHLD